MATDHNFRVKNGLEVGGVLIANSSGQLTVGELYHNGSLRLSTTTSGIEVEGPNGDVTIGAQNTTGLHIYTDRDRFYFNKITSHISNSITSYSGDFNLQRQESTKLTLTSTGASVTGDLSVSGDLNITGDINSVSVTDLDVVDKTITVGQGQSASNSTGSGLVVSGANANMLWDNSDDRWEFNKDVYTDGAFEVGNIRIYKSGDSNHLHISAPTAIIGPSTTTSSNPKLGTSSYRWNGFFSSTGDFSGDMTIAGTTLINGANDNSGKADFAVDVGGSPQISLNGNQVQFGSTDMNWASKFFHDSSGGHVATWDNNLEFLTQGSNTGSATARDIIFSPQTSGTAVPTERMRIKGSGNVGIGTNNPQAMLHIHDNSATSDMLFHTDGQYNDVKFNGGSSGTSGVWEFVNTGTWAQTRFYVQDANNDDGRLTFDFRGNGTSNKILAGTSAGKVGIGTITPLQLLHLRMPNLSGGNNGNGLLVADDGAQLKLEVRKGTGGVNADRRIALYEDGGNYPLYLQEEGGNVGIGKFQTTQSNANNLQSLTPTSLLHLMSHGMVGSGTDVMLRLESYISDYSAVPKKIAIEFKGQDSNNNANFARISQATVNDTDYGENNEATSNIIFGMTQSGTYNERVIMTGAGKVGIQTLNPAQSLHIGNAGHILFERGGELRSKDTGGTEKTLVRVNGSNELEYGWSGAGAVKFMGGGSYTERMRIHTNGNIGIGTTNPQGRLDVDGDLRVTANIVSNTVYQMLSLGSDRTVDDYGGLNKDYWRINLATPGANTDGGSSAHAYGTLIFSGVTGVNTTYVDRMAILPGGNVGIGTNTPIQKLQVVGSIYANGGQLFLDSGNKLIWGNSQQWIQASNSASMFFATNGQNRLELQTDGDLIVSGDIFMGDEHIDFKTNGSSQVPQLRGHRSTVDLDSRNFTTEGGFSYTTFDSSTSNKPSHVSNNANGVITLNTHNGSYNHQLAFTNKGNIAQRSRDGGGYTSWYNILTDRAPNNPSITSTTTVNETIEIVFAASTSGDHVAATSYEVWSDGGTGSDYSLIAKIPYNDIASSMSVVDSSFDDSGTIAYRVYAIKNGVYSTASTTTHSFSMPSLDVSNMSVVADTTNYYIQYDMPDTRFLDHVEIYMDAEASSSNLTRTGATLVYSGTSDSYMYNISSSDMEKYHQFWVEVVTV